MKKNSLIVLAVLLFQSGIAFADATVADIARPSVARTDARAFLLKLSDEAFVSRLMKTAKAPNNAAETARLIQSSIKARSEVLVESIDTDWCITVTFRAKKFSVTIKVGTSCGRG